MSSVIWFLLSSVPGLCISLIDPSVMFPVKLPLVLGFPRFPSHPAMPTSIASKLLCCFGILPLSAALVSSDRLSRSNPGQALMKSALVELAAFLARDALLLCNYSISEAPIGGIKNGEREIAW